MKREVRDAWDWVLQALQMQENSLDTATVRPTSSDGQRMYLLAYVAKHTQHTTHIGDVIWYVHDL